MERCCLCLSLVTDSTSKSKRRKLYNVSCAEYKVVLERLSLQCAKRPFSSYQETSNRDAYLCHRCVDEVKSIDKLERALQTKTQKVLDKLNHLTVLPQSTQVTIGHKRPIVASTSSNPSMLERQKRPSVIPPQQTSSATNPGQPNHQSSSQIDLSVVIDYQSGPRRYKITDPLRKSYIRKLTFKRYKKLAGLLVNSSTTAKCFRDSFGRKVCSELADICSKKADSLLRDVNEAVKQFSWETVWLEFERRLPTLVGLLQLILPSSSKAVLCFIIGIILKNRSPHMALIQRAVSVMLYAHGAGKQVYKSLQPLMVCLSHKRTIALVNRLSEDHDADVLFWAEDLKRFIEEQPVHHDILIAGDEIDMDQFESPAQDEDFVIDSNPINSSSSTSSSDDDVPTDDSESSVMGSPIDRSYTVQETSMSELEASFIPPPHSPIRLSDEDCTSPRQTEEVYPTAAENSVDQQMVTNYTLRDVPANDITCTPTLNPGNQSHWSGFKIVIDNVDKNFRPRYQRVDHQTKSLHCVHMYASKDRIDFSSFSNSKPEQVSVTPEDILPNYSDFSGIKEHFKVLVSRVLVQRLEQFSSQKRDVQWHLPSAYSNEMSMKSTVVPLGIIDQNENRVDEMAEILDQLHKYVPAKSYEVTTHLIDEGEELVHRGYNFHQIACTGDQLTVARQRTAKAVRHHSEDELDRLEGLVPSVEDWHTKQLLVKVIWKWLYSKQSSTEIGTLYQLKNTINRTNVPSDPKDNLNACEDFLGVVLEAHIVAAAKTLLSSTEYESVFGLAASIVDSFLQIDLPNTQPSQTQQPGRSRRRGTRQQPVPVDGVHIYGTDVLTLGLLWLGFSDAIKEGDGDKVFVYWKFLLLVFKSGGCRNYSIEAVKLLYQTHTLSPRLAAQLKWGRFINTHGRQGCNISGDLYLEHLNNRLKGTLCNLGPNNKTDTIQRAAKTVGVVSKVCQQFEKETCTVKDSDNHKRKPYTQDFNLILAILEEKDVFSNKPNRAHKSFALTQGHMQGFNDDKIHKWLQDKIESVKKYY